MKRIIGLDYGQKRCGLATTDLAQIIVNPLTTVARGDLWSYLERYLAQEPVEALVVGQVHLADGRLGALEGEIAVFLEDFQKRYPEIRVFRHDEAYTSKRAEEALRLLVSRKKRQKDKGLLDQMSAAIMLQSFLGHG